MSPRLGWAAVLATLVLAGRALAADAADVDPRLRDIERRLDRLEAGGTEPAAVPPANPVAPPTGFNPAVSLVLSGLYTHLSQDPGNSRITGFPVPDDIEIGPGERGFSLAESELALFANIDPYFYVMLTYAIEPDDSASVEEAFIQTIALSNGFTVKAGRFFSAIGYLNVQHRHAWDFVDAPLAYRAFLGTQFGDDGVQLTWLAPTELFLELGTEIGRGRAFPGSDRDQNGVGAGTVFAHVGGDVGASQSWRAGLSWLGTSPRDREFTDTHLGGNDVINVFNGDSRLWIADLVWKWAPNGNPTYRNAKVQAEYLRRREDGDLIYDAEGAAATAPYDARQAGWYLQGVYQFRRHWRVGLRTERLDHGEVDLSANRANLAQPDFDPKKNTVMVDWSPSELSRVRVQYARDESRQGATDHQWHLQYLMSLGAHGAHAF